MVFSMVHLILAHPFAQAAVGGLLIGLASWLLLASLGRIAGITDIVAGAVVPPPAAPGSERAWRGAFLIGLILVGAGLATLLHTPSPATRPLWLLIAAGLLVGFGTVLGSGCTSGHGVCGIGRRSKRSIVATLVFMGTGSATVFIVNLLTNTPAGA
jgi:uncharacterized protein